MNNNTYRFAVLPVLLCLSFSAQAMVIHDEDIDGDLSDDNLNPTALALGVGSNEVSGSTVSSPLDRDVLTVTVGAGQQLDALVLSSYTNTDDQSFLGYEVGNIITNFSGTGPTFAWTLIGAASGKQVGDNLLDDLAGGALGPGSYTFWAQETSGTTSYTFDYQVSAIPVPAAVWLFGSGLLGLFGIARRKKN